MKLEEKVERLEKHCDRFHSCFDCVLSNSTCDWDMDCSYNTIEVDYAKLFPEDKGVAQENDVVNHPDHYCREGAMESIDEMIMIFGEEAVMHFCICNAWKYRARALNKNGEEDLRKSDWYLRKYGELKGILGAVNE